MFVFMIIHISLLHNKKIVKEILLEVLEFINMRDDDELFCVFFDISTRENYQKQYQISRENEIQQKLFKFTILSCLLSTLFFACLAGFEAVTVGLFIFILLTYKTKN